MLFDVYFANIILTCVSIGANSVNPDHTALKGAVWSDLGPHLHCLSKNDKNISADDINRQFVIGALRALIRYKESFFLPSFEI